MKKFSVWLVEQQKKKSWINRIFNPPSQSVATAKHHRAADAKASDQGEKSTDQAVQAMANLDWRPPPIKFRKT